MKPPSPTRPYNPHNTLELAILQSVADHNHPRRGLAVGHPFFSFTIEQIDQTVVAVLDAGYVVRPTRRRYELTDDGVARLKTLRQASADAEHRYQRSIGGRRGRSNSRLSGRAAKMHPVERRLLHLLGGVTPANEYAFLMFLRYGVPTWLGSAPEVRVADLRARWVRAGKGAGDSFRLLRSEIKRIVAEVRLRPQAEQAQMAKLGKSLPWIWAAFSGPLPDRWAERYENEVPYIRDWITGTSPNLGRAPRFNFDWAAAHLAADAWHQEIANPQKVAAAKKFLAMELRRVKPAQVVEDVPGWEGAWWASAGSGLSRKALQAVGLILGHCYQHPDVLSDYQARGHLFVLFDRHSRPKLALHAKAWIGIRSWSQRRARSKARWPDVVPLRGVTAVGEVRVAQDLVPPEKRYGLVLYRSLPALGWKLRTVAPGVRLKMDPLALWPPQDQSRHLGVLEEMAFPGPEVVALRAHLIEGDEWEYIDGGEEWALIDGGDDPAHHAAVGDRGRVISVEAPSRVAWRTGRVFGVAWDKGGTRYYVETDPDDKELVTFPGPNAHYRKIGDVYVPSQLGRKLRRGRGNKADLAAAAKRLRTRAEAIWRRIGPQARHPDYRTKKKPAAGRCYQTALWLKGKLGKFGSPKLIRGTGDFSHHFWVRVGGTDIDITGDQYGKPKVQVGKLPYGTGSERSWPSKPAPAGHPGAMVRAEASGRANRGRANAESMFFRSDESPLDYRRGVHVRRLMVFDPGAGPADELDRRYFGGRSEVAFVDYYKRATGIYILYATVRGDYRGQGLLRKMITEFYARRHPRTTVIDWGDIYSPAMEKLYLEYRVRDDGVWTKGCL